MLDFRMKHEGEPPARLLAQVRMRLKQENYPPQLAEYLAPVMTSAEDLEAIIAVLKEHIADSAGPDDEADDADDIDANAWHHAKRRPTMSKTLTGRLYQKLNNRGGPKVRINGRGPSVARLADQGASMRAALSDALQARLDRRHKPTVGQGYVSLSLGEMLMSSLRSAGHRPSGMRDAIRMYSSHTTSDFPLILEDALSKTVARQLDQVTPALARAAHEIHAEDYRPGNLLGLSASGVPQEILETGEIKHVTIDQRGELKPAPRDFGAMFRLLNKAIVNDDLGVLADGVSKQMVAGAVERFRRVLLEPVVANGGLGHTMADGLPVFHENHNNLASAGGALDIPSLSAARLGLRSQRGSQGEFYAIEPWALVVPPQLETTAQQVLAEINATKTSDVNPFSGSLELIVEVGLTNSTAWYLIGNPASTDGLAYSFLDGQAAPRVESRLGWETLGTEFRLTWALDARFVSYASWFKNPGA